MNIEVVRGRILQLAGKLFELFGRLTGSELQRRHGYQLVIVGRMRVLGGQATDLLRYCDPRLAATAEPRRLTR